MKAPLGSVLLTFLLAPAAMSQEQIDPAHQYSWGENIGWMNWRDAGEPPGSLGVRVHPSFLSGFIWAESAGWINVGSGRPADGIHYGNAESSDFGINLESNGDLTGYAWGENIGWLVFDPRSLGGQRALLDSASRRFRGYAWGENVGWINLDDPEHFVGLGSPDEPVFRRGDSNADSRVDISDVIRSVGCLFLGAPCTLCSDAGDSNDDGKYDIADPVHTLAWLFFGGFPPPPPGPLVCGPDVTPDAFKTCIYESCF